MKIVFLSDTHGMHHKVNKIFPGWDEEADCVVFAGDMCGRGNHGEVRDFFNWFETLKPKHKIIIAGNHDIYLDFNHQRHMFTNKEKHLEYASQFVNHPEIHYLNDSGVTIDGINFWGSPIQPRFGNWAFNRDRGEDIKAHWDMIPNGIDVLITHGPPKGILDRIHPMFERYNEDPNVGCWDLLQKVIDIKPKVHVFGHIHETYGMEEHDGVTYINASFLNHRYIPVNEPIVFDVDI